MTWETKALALPLGSPTCTPGKKPEDSEVFCMYLRPELPGNRAFKGKEHTFPLVFKSDLVSEPIC